MQTIVLSRPKYLSGEAAINQIMQTLNMRELSELSQATGIKQKDMQQIIDSNEVPFDLMLRALIYKDASIGEVVLGDVTSVSIDKLPEHIKLYQFDDEVVFELVYFILEAAGNTETTYVDKLKDVIERELVNMKEPFTSLLLARLDEADFSSFASTLLGLEAMNSEPNTTKLETELSEYVSTVLLHAYQSLL